MPSFRGKFSEPQARTLVAYIREVAGVKRPEHAPTDFERRFAELEEELKELKKQFRALASTSRDQDK